MQKPMLKVHALLLMLAAGTSGNAIAGENFLSAESGARDPNQCIFGGGAALHQSIFNAWVREHEKSNPGGCLSYSVTGGWGGLRLLSTGRSDFSVYEVPWLKNKQDPGSSFNGVHIGVVAIAPIYNLGGVQKLRLSKKTVLAIFSGEVRKWNDRMIRIDNPDADLPSVDILLYHDLPSAQFRGGSGSEIFMRYLLSADHLGGRELSIGHRLADSKRYKGAEGATGFVRQNHGALSYAPVGPSPSGFKYAAVENDFGEFIEPASESISAATQKYSMRNGAGGDLTFEPVRGAYPIVAPMTIYYDRNGRKKAEVEKFIVWALSEGQSIARRMGLPSLSSSLARRELRRMQEQGRSDGQYRRTAQ